MARRSNHTTQDPPWTDTEAEGLPVTEDQPPGIGPETAEEGLMPPRDRPLGALEYGTTAEEQLRPESVAERSWREEPEVGADDLGSDEVSTVDVSTVDTIDDPAGLGRPLAGRLEDEDDLEEGPSLRADGDGRMTGLLEPDVEGLSAEEAALHVTEDP